MMDIDNETGRNNKDRGDNVFSSMLGKHSNLYLSIASVALIGILVYSNYTEPVNSIYSNSTLYVGVNDGEDNVDIKQKYNDMIGSDGAIDDNAKCANKTPTEYDNAVTFPSAVGLQGNYWPAVLDAVNIPATEEDITTKYARDDSDPTKWYLWGTEADGIKDYYIISPYRSFVFINGNTESPNTIKISPTIDNKYVIVFHNVKNWYCHLNSVESATSHMYKTSEYCKDEMITGGTGLYILGMATADTYVTVENKEDSTSTKTLWSMIANPE